MWYLRLLRLLWFVTDPTNPGPGETVGLSPKTAGIFILAQVLRPDPIDTQLLDTRRVSGSIG